MAADRKNGKADKLEPDSKSQVTMMYENGATNKSNFSCYFYTTFS